MLEINFGAFPVLKTERLLMRQMHYDDAETLFRLRSDPRVMQYFGRPLMQSVEEARAFLVQSQDLFAKNEGILWALSLHNMPQMIGSMTIWRIDKTNHRAEIGYMLDPDYQGKGLMSEALGALLKYGFESLHLHSLEANVNPDNQASINLLERNGFLREAYFRENYYFNGLFEDSAIYSLLTPVGRTVTLENTIG